MFERDKLPECERGLELKNGGTWVEEAVNHFNGSSLVSLFMGMRFLDTAKAAAIIKLNSKTGILSVIFFTTLQVT